MKRMNVLVVDDERYAREELRHLLSKFPSIKVIGEAESGEEALVKAMQVCPDVVFLDIEMPGMNGMEAAKSFASLKCPPKVVFATAYRDFAAEAFRYEAVDYLLKPYDEDQLHETISRLEKLLVVSPEPESPTTKVSGKLAVERDGEICYLDPGDIRYIYREEKESKIITGDGEYEIKSPLKDLEVRLHGYSIVRIHKSYLVNLQYITKLSPWFNGAYHLELEGRKEKLSVSRNYVKLLRDRLEV